MLRAAAPAATADAATYCVDVRVHGLRRRRTTAADAFTAARADTERDTILLGRISEAGRSPTRRAGRCAWSASAPTRPGCAPVASAARRCGCSTRAAARAALRIDGGGAAPALQIDDGARLRLVVEGRVRVRGGAAELSSVLVATRPAPAVEASCEAASARLALEHVTVTRLRRRGRDAGRCATAGRTRRA